MGYDDFRTLALEAREFAHGLVLYLLGESLLHPRFFGLVACAEELGLRCTVTTNGELLDRHVADVFGSRLTSLCVTVDGATPATHARYRRGGDVTRVMAAVERVLAERRRLGRGPHVAVQTLALPFNAEERESIKTWALNAGADAFVVRDVNVGIRRTDAAARALALEYVEPAAWERAIAKGVRGKCEDGSKCGELRRATVLWNGDVVPCMRSAWDGRDSFGNVFRDGGLRSVWRSKRHLEHLRRHLALVGRGQCASSSDAELSPTHHDSV